VFVADLLPHPLCLLFVRSLQFPEFDTLYCKVGFVYGADWTVLAGIEEGVSQVASRSHDGAGRFVWNFPIELTLRSTNPFAVRERKEKKIKKNEGKKERRNKNERKKKERKNKAKKRARERRKCLSFHSPSTPQGPRLW
jgi:hypothetical protein